MESFVYEWINKLTNMRYIGKHVGSPDDGYIASGKYFLIEYKECQDNFERIILWQGKESECIAMESFYIKTRVKELGIELLYNRLSTQGALDFDFYYRHNLINFVKCNHCGAVFNKTGDFDENKLIEFEHNHFDNCLPKRKPNNKRLHQTSDYFNTDVTITQVDCRRLHNKIDKYIKQNKNQFLIKKFKEILKEKSSKCDYAYPY